MRTGLAVSAVLHAALLSWGLISLDQPQVFDVEDVEALPVDLVDIAELTQVQEGSETAPRDGPATPDPIENPNPDPVAENLGRQEEDQATPETEQQLETAVEEARLPEPSDVPVPRPAPRDAPVPESTPEPEEPPAEPTPEVAPEPQPRQEVTPDPVREAIENAQTQPLPEESAPDAEVAEAAPAEEFIDLPAQLPTIASRPERPPAQSAQTPQRQNRSEEQAQSAVRNNEQDTSEDEVAALINRDRGSGGGAASNADNASRGSETTTAGETLTQSEMDALRGQIQACWNPPQGIDAASMRVSVQFELDRNGQVSGRPQVIDSSGNRQADESARRAVLRCGQNGYRLPAEKFDAWRNVIVNFDPAEMFR